MEKSGMYATVRRYEGVPDPKEAARRVQKEFVPFISKLPGFIEYFWIDLGNKAMLSITVFNSLPEAIEANHKAVSWVSANLSSVLPETPRTEAGKVVAYKEQ